MKRLYILGILLCVAVGTSAQELRDTLQLYYKTSSSRVDTLYVRNNESFSSFYERNLARFNNPNLELKKVTVIGSASPDGTLNYNESLALRRAHDLADYLKQRLPLPEASFEVTSVGVDWAALTELVMATNDMPYRKDVLKILQKDYSHNARLLALKRTNGRNAYRWMYKHLFPLLRNAKTLVYYEEKEQPVPVEEVIEEHVAVIKEAPAVQELPSEAEPATVIKSSQPSSKEIFFLRSNLLLPLGNIGVAVPIGNRWSVGADYYYPWLKRKSNHKDCVQAIMWNLEGRYWLGKDRKREDVLEGHSVGFNAMAGYYDLEKNYEGYQGDFVNFSLDYTYALPIFKDKLHLEFTVGLGYFYSLATKYAVYEEGGKGYKAGYKEKFRYWGPNKLAISIVVPIKTKERE